MQNRLLLIGELEKVAIKNLIFYAENNKISYDQMKKIMKGNLPPVGDNPNHSITIPLDFRIVFSIENHPGGWFKHLSISIPTPKRGPNPYAVQMIMDEFSMGELKRRPENSIYIEDLGDDIKAINIIHPYGDSSETANA